ncbi:MAG: hypothetical protein ABI666_03700 [Ferruginibacter sp.]
MSVDDKNIDPINKSEVAEMQAAYEKAELNLLKDALKRTYMERFLFATQLYKIQQTLKKATLTHQPYKPAK